MHSPATSHSRTSSPITIRAFRSASRQTRWRCWRRRRKRCSTRPRKAFCRTAFSTSSRSPTTKRRPTVAVTHRCSSIAVATAARFSAATPRSRFTSGRTPANGPTSATCAAVASRLKATSRCTSSDTLTNIRTYR